MSKVIHPNKKAFIQTGRKSYTSTLHQKHHIFKEKGEEASIFHLATALHEWYRPNITDVGTTVTQVDTGSVGGIDLANPDAASEPTVNANTLGYDGVAQHLEKATTNFRSADASGVIHCKFKATDNTLNKNNFLFAAAKTSVNDLLNISYRNLHPRFAFQDFGVDVLVLEGSNPFVFNDVNTLTVFSTGTSIKMAVNGVVVASSVISGTNNGQWFHDITGGTDNVTLAAQKTTSNGFGKSEQYGVWYEPYTSEANALANGLDIQNNAI